MVVPCQACGAANDDEARFCDQCGSALEGALAVDSSISARPVPSPAARNAPPPQSASRESGASVNWLGMGIFAVVLGSLGFLVFGGNGGQEPAPAGGGAEQTMMQAQAELEENKRKLEANPLDVDALRGMYGLYGQIGEPEKVRPYLDKAIAEARTRLVAGKLEQEAAKKAALDMAMISMEQNDPVASLQGMEFYYELTPERPSTAAMIANINYDIGFAAEALKWYDIYLAAADPALEGDSYLGAQVDRETMRMTLAKEDEKPELLDEAIQKLEEITAARPDFWAAWFNLGQAYTQRGEKEQALEVWRRALELATSPEDKWRTEAAIAETEGKPAPPMPQGMGMGAMDTLDPAQNPHATSATPPPAAGSGVDPHAGLGF